MVFKDLEGTKQARKELAERESKILLSLQGGKPPKVQPKKPTSLLEMIKASFEDFKQFKDMYKHADLAGMSDDYEQLAEVSVMNHPFGTTLSEMNQLKALLQSEFETPMPEYTGHQNITLPKVESPAYLAFKKKMAKVQKRKLLKSLILKHGTKQAELSLVDTALTEEQVDEMIQTCLKLEEVKGMLGEMPEVDLFGEYGY